MKWSWRLATVRGIEIKVHISFLLILVWGGLIWGNEGLAGALYGAFLTLMVFVFVLLHELGHAIAAQRYGIQVQDIVLLPIGGLARLSRMPEKPAQELVVALAGPAVNLLAVMILLPPVAAAIGAQVLGSGTFVMPDTRSPGLLNLAAFLLTINLSLLLFNLLPAFPLDGGRVLRALLAMRLSYGRATAVAATLGKVFAVIFGFVGLLIGSPALAVIGFFVLFSAGAEGQEVVVKETLRGIKVVDVVDPSAPTLPADAPAHVGFERLARSPYLALAVLDEDGTFQGVVTRAGMQRKWSEGLRGAVGAFAEPPHLVMPGEASLDAARRDMAQADISVVAVFVQGCFAGLLDIATIGRVLAMRRAMPHDARA